MLVPRSSVKALASLLMTRMNLPQKRAPETKEARVSAFPSLETLSAAGKEVNPGDKLRKHTLNAENPEPAKARSPESERDVKSWESEFWSQHLQRLGCAGRSAQSSPNVPGGTKSGTAKGQKKKLCGSRGLGFLVRRHPPPPPHLSPTTRPAHSGPRSRGAGPQGLKFHTHLYASVAQQESQGRQGARKGEGFSPYLGRLPWSAPWRQAIIPREWVRRGETRTSWSPGEEAWAGDCSAVPSARRRRPRLGAPNRAASFTNVTGNSSAQWAQPVRLLLPGAGCGRCTDARAWERECVCERERAARVSWLFNAEYVWSYITQRGAVRDASGGEFTD